MKIKQELLPSLLSILMFFSAADVLASSTAAPLAFNNNQTVAYQTLYSEINWTGDLLAMCLDDNGSFVSCNPGKPGESVIKWSADLVAANNGPAWKDRSLVTIHSENRRGVEFRWQNLSPEQLSFLGKNEMEQRKVIDWLRGDNSSEQKKGGSLRDRLSRFGSFVNSEPVPYADIILLGGNDGMLHIFDAGSGRELGGYIPNLLFKKWQDNSGTTPLLQRLTAIDFLTRPHYMVDGTVRVKYLQDNRHTLVAGGLGKGGKGVYCLNLKGLRQPGFNLAAAVLWEYPAADRDLLRLNIRLDQNNNKISEFIPLAGNVEDNEKYRDNSERLFTDPYMGYVPGRPEIVKIDDGSAAGLWVVIVANGYESYNGNAALYILDALDGRLLQRIIVDGASKADTQKRCSGKNNCNGLSAPAVVDVDQDGLVDYAYAGDLQGNMWKFDLRLRAGEMFPANCKVYYRDFNGTARPLITVRDSLGNIQPITVKPSVTMPCDNKENGLMLTFGTGSLLQPDDYKDLSPQTLYGIWDWGEAWEKQQGVTAATSYYGNVVRQNSGAGLDHKTALPGGNGLDRFITLQKQTVAAFAGINYYAAGDPKVDGVTVKEGDVKLYIPDPSDLKGYDNIIRTLSDNRLSWFSAVEYQQAGGMYPTALAHVGWLFDLPLAGERITTDPTVMSGKLISQSIIPSISGGNSIVMAQNSCSGGRLEKVFFDLNDDQSIDHNDGFSGKLSGLPDKTAVTGLLYHGITPRFTVLAKGTGKSDRLFVSQPQSQSVVKVDDPLVLTRPEVDSRAVDAMQLGFFFWRQIDWN